MKLFFSKSYEKKEVDGNFQENRDFDFCILKNITLKYVNFCPLFFNSKRILIIC